MAVTELEADVVVVGLGPGGETVAGLVGRAGLEVVGVEEHLVGGECPFYGCVPSKMMVSAAHRLGEAGRIPHTRDAAAATTLDADFATVARRVREEATRDWDDAVFADRITRNGVRLLRGQGRLAGPGVVDVALADGGSCRVRARRGVVLGTGTTPAVPPVDGLAGTPYWTNREVVRVEQPPASLVVLGGGPIGVEFAQVFARFGTEVTLVEAAPRLLPGDEPEAGPLLATALAADGVEVRTGSVVDAVRHGPDGFTLTVGEDELSAEQLLVATGRRTCLDVGLDTVGLVAPGGDLPTALATDERLRVVGAPGLWAVGDITGEGAFTHLATHQARIAARDLLDQGGPWADYRAVPRVTYTDPEVAAVGMTEEQAREAGLAVDVASSDLGARGWLEQYEGLVKLVADRSSGLLVGATVVGPTAGEVLSMLVVAVEHRIPVTELRRTIFAYPTWHRAVESALHRLGR